MHAAGGSRRHRTVLPQVLRTAGVRRCSGRHGPPRPISTAEVNRRPTPRHQPGIAGDGRPRRTRAAIRGDREPLRQQRLHVRRPVIAHAVAETRRSATAQASTTVCRAALEGQIRRAATCGDPATPRPTTSPQGGGRDEPTTAASTRRSSSRSVTSWRPPSAIEAPVACPRATAAGRRPATSSVTSGSYDVIRLDRDLQILRPRPPRVAAPTSPWRNGPPTDASQRGSHGSLVVDRPGRDSTRSSAQPMTHRDLGAEDGRGLVVAVSTIANGPLGHPGGRTGR